jgi:hypothetical protein
MRECQGDQAASGAAFVTLRSEYPQRNTRRTTPRGSRLSRFRLLVVQFAELKLPGGARSYSACSGHGSGKRCRYSLASSITRATECRAVTSS